MHPISEEGALKIDAISAVQCSFLQDLANSSEKRFDNKSNISVLAWKLFHPAYKVANYLIIIVLLCLPISTSMTNREMPLGVDLQVINW